MTERNRDTGKHALPTALLAAIVLLAAAHTVCRGQTPARVEVPNHSFEQGTGPVPLGWTAAGACTWGTDGGADGVRFISLQDDGVWRSAPLALTPGGHYELRFRYRARPAPEAGPGFGIAGPEFAIRLFPLDGDTGEAWQEQSVRFTVPDEVDDETFRLHFSQWQFTGGIDFDAAEVIPLALTHREAGGMTLGDGEHVSGNEYLFRAPLDSTLSRTISRPLVGYNDRFHDNRWRFAKPGAYVLYRHEIPNRRQVRATVEAEAWFHEESSWSLIVEASVDGRSFRPLGRFSHGDAGGPLDVPADMLPASALWIRLRADATDGDRPVFFQTREYRYTAILDGPPVQAAGATTAVAILGVDPTLDVTPVAAPDRRTEFAARATNRGAAAVELAPTLAVRHESGAVSAATAEKTTLAPGASVVVRIPYATPRAGRYELEFRPGPGLATRLGTTATVSIIDHSGYGERLASPEAGVALWWADSGWKVGRTRPAPETAGTDIRIALAANEAEAAQLVVRPDRDLQGLTAEIAGDLRSPAGDVLPAADIDVLRVRYVSVDYASDHLGGTGEWPDPLPPFAGGIDVPADSNQPLWVLVRAPADAKPGHYRGDVVLRAAGFEARVPLSVEVFGFALPDTTTCRSLFGFGAHQVWRYHDLRTLANKRAVTDAYLRSFAEHRVSPYNPAPLDGFTATWTGGPAWEGGRVVAGGREGGHSLLAEDSDTGLNMQATYSEAVPLTGAPVRLDLWYRTESVDQPAFLYVSHLDAAGNHIAYRNRQVELPPSPEWRRLEQTLAGFPEGTTAGQLSLQGCPWTMAGELTGRVWIDDISLTDETTGAALLRDGDFETAAAAVPEVRFDWTAWDAAMTRAVEEYHFNSFVFPVPGLGGGTFHSRWQGSLQGFVQGTPEHTAHFSAWCREARAHLLEAGLLDKAVVYPFDEPAEKDYPFVVEQLRLLRDHFPGLRRMVPMNLGAADPFVGEVDFWCPILDSHRPGFAAERQRAGDVYTWYICCAPKAPYVANFIDRAGTDLRVWLWQTWKEKVDGILIWDSTYWHSANAYPDGLQNPYLDSMSWVSGYDTQPGEKRRWNAGDGRFLYPPESAADGAPTAPVLEGPVSSIRWEALRDGIEDFEYLAILERLLQRKRAGLAPADAQRCEALLTVPPEITRSLAEYTRDPGPIRVRRREIAAAIVRLAGQP